MGGMGPFKEGFPAPTPRTRGVMGPVRTGPPQGPFLTNSQRSRNFAGPAPRPAAAPTVAQMVSRMGVDPRSPQGKEIADLIASGADPNDPMMESYFGELVAEYQESLIGPLSKRGTPAPGDAMGPFFDREDNQFGYTAGDAFGELDNLSTENLARIQSRLVGLGLLDGFVPGRKDPETQKAFAYLLEMANASGRNWASELSDLERLQAEDPENFLGGAGGSGSGRGRAPFTAPAYLAPDYATLAQGVKDQMRQALGRDPDDDEIAQLTAELDGWYRQSYDEEVEAARREYEMAEEGGTPEAGRSVDPASRFKESFESKFAGEIAFREQKDEVEGQQELVQGAVSAVSQMAGGMG